MNNKLQLFIKSFKSALPILSGYIPLGFICGILLSKAGLMVWEVGLMSLLVYAGSAQFIAASLLATGENFIAIIIATFIINFRHFLMSVNLSSVIKSKNYKFLAFFAYGITDETYAININKYDDTDWQDTNALLVNILANSVWVICTFLGASLGEVIHINADFAGFILIAMFVCLAVINVKNIVYVIVATVSVIISILLLIIWDNNFYIIIAAIVASYIGYIIEVRKERGLK